VHSFLPLVKHMNSLAGSGVKLPRRLVHPARK
jgi:hypothetical protein